MEPATILEGFFFCRPVMPAIRQSYFSMVAVV
jgi:hypothetical protein